MLFWIGPKVDFQNSVAFQDQYRTTTSIFNAIGQSVVELLTISWISADIAWCCDLIFDHLTLNFCHTSRSCVQTLYKHFCCLIFKEGRGQISGQFLGEHGLNFTKTWRGHRDIVGAHQVCFRYRVLFRNAGSSKLSNVEKWGQISHFLTPMKIGEKWLRSMINKSSYTYNRTSSIYLTGGLFAAAKSQATVKIEK